MAGSAGSTAQTFFAEFDQSILPNVPTLNGTHVGLYRVEDGRQYVAGTDFVVDGIGSGSSADRLRVRIVKGLATGLPASVYLLPSGNYEITVDGAAVKNAAGDTIAKDGAPEAIGETFFFRGDINHDRKIDFDELLMFAQHYGQTNIGYAEGDFTFDGTVDFDDLLFMAQNYQSTWPAPLQGANALQASTGRLTDPNFDPQHTATPSNAAYVEWTAPPATAGVIYAGYNLYRSIDGVNFSQVIPTLPITQLSYIDRGLLEGERYSYRVRPVTAGGIMGMTTNKEAVVTTLRAASNVSASATGATSIRVTWSDSSSNEDTFTVGVYDAQNTLIRSILTAANATGVEIDGLVEATTYTVRVVSNTAAAHGAAATATVTTRLAPPADVAIGGSAEGGYTVSWTDASAHEDGYAVRWFANTDYTDANGVFHAAGTLVGSAIVGALAGAGSTHHIDVPGVGGNDDVYFDVTANGTGGTPASTTTQSGTSTQGHAPTYKPVASVRAEPIVAEGTSPASADAFNRAADQIKVKWTDNQRGVLHYYVWMESPQKALLAIVPGKSGSGGKFEYVATALDPNQSYTFAVQPEVQDADEIAAKTSDAAATGLQSAGQKVGFWVQEVTGHSVRLRWNPIEGERATFTVYYWIEGATQATEINAGSAAANELKVSALYASTAYHFTLRVVYHDDRYTQSELAITTPEDTDEEAEDRAGADTELAELHLMSLSDLRARARLYHSGDGLREEEDGGLGWYRDQYFSSFAVAGVHRAGESWVHKWRLRLANDYVNEVIRSGSENVPDNGIPDEIPSSQHHTFSASRNANGSTELDFGPIAPENESNPGWTNATYDVVREDGTYENEGLIGPDDDATYTISPGVTVRFAQKSGYLNGYNFTRRQGVETYTAPDYRLRSDDGWQSESDAGGDDGDDTNDDGNGEDENGSDRSPRPSRVKVTESTDTTNVLSLRDNSKNEDGIEIERSRDGSHWSLVTTVAGMNEAPPASAGLIGGRGAGDDYRHITVTDAGLTPGIEYEYRARAFKWSETDQYVDEFTEDVPLHALEFTHWSAKAKGLTDAHIGVFAETPTVTEGQTAPGKFGVYRIGEFGEPIDVEMSVPGGSATYFADYKLLDGQGLPTAPPGPNPPFDFAYAMYDLTDEIRVDVSMIDDVMDDADTILLQIANDSAQEPLYEPAGIASTMTIREIVVDVDVDTARTEGLKSPSRTAGEEVDENKPGEVGKIVATNDDDRNVDGIPDFSNGLKGLDNASESLVTDAQGGRFVPVAITVSSMVDVATATFRFDYDGSDPSLVEKTGAGTSEDPFVYTAAAGKLRLWTKDGDLLRDPSGNLAGGGNYIQPGQTYTGAAWSKIGIGSNRNVTLYLEGIGVSAAKGDATLTLTVINGSTTRADAVNTTVVDVDVLIGANAPTDASTHDDWVSAKTNDGHEHKIYNQLTMTGPVGVEQMVDMTSNAPQGGGSVRIDRMDGLTVGDFSYTLGVDVADAVDAMSFGIWGITASAVADDTVVSASFKGQIFASESLTVLSLPTMEETYGSSNVPINPSTVNSVSGQRFGNVFGIDIGKNGFSGNPVQHMSDIVGGAISPDIRQSKKISPALIEVKWVRRIGNAPVNVDSTSAPTVLQLSPIASGISGNVNTVDNFRMQDVAFPAIGPGQVAEGTPVDYFFTHPRSKTVTGAIAPEEYAVKFRSVARQQLSFPVVLHIVSLAATPSRFNATILNRIVADANAVLSQAGVDINVLPVITYDVPTAADDFDVRDGSTGTTAKSLFALSPNPNAIDVYFVNTITDYNFSLFFEDESLNGVTYYPKDGQSTRMPLKGIMIAGELKDTKNPSRPNVVRPVSDIGRTLAHELMHYMMNAGDSDHAGVDQDWRLMAPGDSGGSNKRDITDAESDKIRTNGPSPATTG